MGLFCKKVCVFFLFIYFPIFSLSNDELEFPSFDSTNLDEHIKIIDICISKKDQKQLSNNIQYIESLEDYLNKIGFWFVCNKNISLKPNHKNLISKEEKKKEELDNFFANNLGKFDRFNNLGIRTISNLEYKYIAQELIEPTSPEEVKGTSNTSKLKIKIKYKTAVPNIYGEHYHYYLVIVRKSYDDKNSKIKKYNAILGYNLITAGEKLLQAEIYLKEKIGQGNIKIDFISYYKDKVTEEEKVFFDSLRHYIQ